MLKYASTNQVAGNYLVIVLDLVTMAGNGDIADDIASGSHAMDR